jgi:hypothetical protein
MLTDIQTPLSDENIFISQPHTEIMMVLFRQSFTNISPFCSNLRKVLQAVAETPPSGEVYFIRKTESNFLIVVCLYFLHSCHRFRVIRVKTHQLQLRRPL